MDRTGSAEVRIAVVKGGTNEMGESRVVVAVFVLADFRNLDFEVFADFWMPLLARSKT